MRAVDKDLLLSTTIFLAQLEEPEVFPVLVGWEKLLVENCPLFEKCLEAVGVIYGRSLPKEDWEFHFFLIVLHYLDELFLLTDRGRISGDTGLYREILRVHLEQLGGGTESTRHSSG